MLVRQMVWPKSEFEFADVKFEGETATKVVRVSNNNMGSLVVGEKTKKVGYAICRRVYDDGNPRFAAKGDIEVILFSTDDERADETILYRPDSHNLFVTLKSGSLFDAFEYALAQAGFTNVAAVFAHSASIAFDQLLPYKEGPPKLGILGL